jgi:hypothetical protein
MRRAVLVVETAIVCAAPAGWLLHMYRKTGIVLLWSLCTRRDMVLAAYTVCSVPAHLLSTSSR